MYHIFIPYLYTYFLYNKLQRLCVTRHCIAIIISMVHNKTTFYTLTEHCLPAATGAAVECRRSCCTLASAIRNNTSSGSQVALRRCICVRYLRCSVETYFAVVVIWVYIIIFYYDYYYFYYYFDFRHIASYIVPPSACKIKVITPMPNIIVIYNGYNIGVIKTASHVRQLL